MSGVAFELEVHGDKLFSRRLLRLEGQVLHAQPAMEEIGLSLIRHEKRLFASQGASGGERWEDDKPATLAAKARKHQDPRVLRARDRLYRSLTERGDFFMLFDATDDGLEFGSMVPYAKYHQRKRGERSLPVRKPIQLREQQKRDTLKILQRHIMAAGRTR